MWATIIWIVVFWRLGYLSLLDSDEAHYAELTREMLGEKSWLVPLLNGSPLIDKPVLFHWLQATAIFAFGESEFALRLPSALAAIALLWTVRWLATELFGRNTGNTAGVMLATLPITFALASVAVFDMVFGALLFGAVATLLVAGLRERVRLQYLGWPLLSLAVMTKGPVAIVLIILLGTALSRSARTWSIVRRLNWIGGLTFACLAASPWFVWMWLTFRGDFVRDYLFAGNLYYFTEPIEFSRRHSDVWFYLRTFVGAFFPWSLIAVGGGVDALRSARRRVVSVEEQTLWWWLLVVIGFFSVARFKVDTYIFPAAPAACILAARAWKRAAEDDSESATTRWAAFAIGVVFVAGGAFASIALFDLDLGLDKIAIVLPAILCGAGIVLIAQLVRRRGALPASVAVPAAAMLGAYSMGILVGLPVLERSRPTAPLGRWIAHHSLPDSPVGVYGVDDWVASIRYYTGRPLVRLDNANEVDRFLEQAPQAFVMMLRSDLPPLRHRGVNVRPVVGRPAIVGRTGKFLRRQVWGRLIVVAHKSNSPVFVVERDGEELEPN